MDEEESNPFLSVALDFFDDDNDSKSRPPPRIARDWGIPTFRDQIDRGITSFRFCDCVTVHLEHRRWSTGSDLWDSSLVIAHVLRNWVQAEAKTMKTWHVLELGSGTGAVGLYCKKALGAHTVVLTDLPENLDLLKKNRAANGLELEVNIAPLDWTIEVLPNEVVRGGQGVDLILGSDLFLPFAPQLLHSLARTLCIIMKLREKQPHLRQTTAILVYEERFDCSEFFSVAQSHGLSVLHMDDSLLHPKYQDPGRIHVLQVSLCTPS